MCLAPMHTLLKKKETKETKKESSPVGEEPEVPRTMMGHIMPWVLPPGRSLCQ